MIYIFHYKKDKKIPMSIWFKACCQLFFSIYLFNDILIPCSNYKNLY